MYPKNLKYTKTHEWVKVEDEEGITGITLYAVEKLKDIVFIELPSLGTIVKKDSSFGTIESVKAVFELNSPVSGEVTAVNEILKTSVDPVIKDPHGQGWIIKVRFKDKNELNDLMGAEEYEDYIKETK